MEKEKNMFQTSNQKTIYVSAITTTYTYDIHDSWMVGKLQVAPWLPIE